jgi:hypothetical protein
MEKKYFIYKYTFPNNKVYIGQTYKGSGRYGKSNKYIGTLVGNAMKKYPNYEKEILEYCSLDDVDQREKYYISLYDSTNRSKGYNRDTGGNLNKKATDDLKKELSLIHTDLQVTIIEQYDIKDNFIKEWKSIKEASNTLNIDRTSISKALHGETKTAGGYKWKLKETYSPYNSRTISQYDLKGNFVSDWNSTLEAEEKLKIHSIINALNGRNKTAGGFQWKYKDDNKKIEAYKTSRIYIAKHIYQYSLDGEFIKEWDSYLKASKELGIPHQHILRVLKGERKMTGGFLFSYEKNDSIEKYNSDIKSFFKPVLQYTIDDIFIKEWPNIVSAERELNIKSGIGKCCKGNQKTAGGYKWKYKK